MSDWELLFEGELTTATDENHDGPYVTFNPTIINPYPYENPPDTERIYRLTVDGFSVSQIVGIEENGFGTYDSYYVGNVALWDNRYDDVDAPDDGTDFCVFAIGYSSIPAVYTNASVFVSREAGTYHVKVERLLKDPVAYSYNGTRLPILPDRESKCCILASQSGTVRLMYPTYKKFFDYSVEQAAFIAQKYEATVECYLYDPAQEHTDWVRWTAGDATLAPGETYPVSGETLIWSNYPIQWHNDISEKFGSLVGTVDTILSPTRAMPIFDYPPVGGEPIDPTSFMQGYIVGRRLAGIRK